MTSLKKIKSEDFDTTVETHLSDSMSKFNLNQIEFLTSLFSGMEKSLCFSVFDSNGRYLFLSPLFAEYFEVKDSNFDESKLENYGSEFHSLEFWMQYKKILKNGEIWRGEILRRDKENNEFCTYTISSLIYSGIGDSKLFIEFHLDITNFKNAELRLKSYEELAIASSRYTLVGQMLGGITHEINNPLTIILGTAKYFKVAIEKGEMTTELVSKGADKIMDAAGRVAKTIKIVKSFSRDSSSDSFTIYSLKEIFSDINLFIGARIKNHGINFELSEVEENLLIFCKPVEITLALLNLIMNSDVAIRDTTNPWMKVTYKKIENDVTLRVTDSGHGIPLDVRGKMMNPFFTTNQLGAGMGLGFSVIQKIVASHSGSFYYDEESENTSFVIRIPISG